MSKKLLASTVASVLALTPNVALAGGSQPQPSPTADKGGNQPPLAWQCFGHIYNCPGYQYQCTELTLGNSPSGFTNSDATEDYYEALTIVTSAGVHLHPWRCYGD